MLSLCCPSVTSLHLKFSLHVAQVSRKTTRNGNGRRVKHAHNPQHHEYRVGDLLPRRRGDSLVVQEGRVDVYERYAGDTTDEGDKAVEVRAATDADGAAEDDEGGAEGVLLPFSQKILLAATVTKQPALEDTHGGEELDGVADKDGEGVEELHRVDKARALGEVVDDFDLGAVAKGGVAECADRGEDAGDDEHDQPQEVLELLRLAHGGMNGDDEADALEGEDGGADGEGVGARIEQLDGGTHAVRDEVGDVVLPDVAEADHDKGIGEGGGGAELRDVTDEAQRDQQQGLQGDEGLDAKRVGAVCDCRQEAEPVVGDEDETCADEAQLRQGDAGQDDVTHPGAGDGLADLTVGATTGCPALEQKVEGPHGDGGDGDETHGREEDTTVVEGLGQEHDAGAHECLEEG